MKNIEFLKRWRPITYHLSPRSGQSIIESIVAIGVLTMGLLGAITLLSRAFFVNRVITDQTTATYLASEGVEIVKNLIDHDVYQHLANPPQGLGWGSCFSGIAGGDTTGFEMDYATNDCRLLQLYSARTLFLDPTTHFYSYASGAGAIPTNFTRRIRVAQNGNEITVNAIVSWSTGPITSASINLEDHFYNWHP